LAIGKCPVLFGTVSAAADMLHCKPSNGNKMFVDPLGTPLADLKPSLIQRNDMQIPHVLRIMPSLANWLQSLSAHPAHHQKGWTKRINQ
jgi:hypothetical protein